mgnify:CR=1 FL=1
MELEEIDRCVNLNTYSNLLGGLLGFLQKLGSARIHMAWKEHRVDAPVDQVLAEVRRVLRPGGRFAITDIVSGRALKERTRRNVELWAACIAGAIPRTKYLEALAEEGLETRAVRKNDYRFISERALDACSTYEVESISLLAVKGG